MWLGASVTYRHVDSAYVPQFEKFTLVGDFTTKRWDGKM